MMLPPRAIDHLAKTSTLGMRNPLWSCWSDLLKRLPKHYKWLLLSLVAPQPCPRVAEDTMHFRHRTQRTRAGSDLKASSLSPSFCNTRKGNVNFRRKEQATVLPSHTAYVPQ